jgi:hypothetical protein
VEQVGHTPGYVGPGANRLAQLLGRPARVSGGLTRALVATHLLEEEKAESVEKIGGGRSTQPPPGTKLTSLSQWRSHSLL